MNQKHGAQTVETIMGKKYIKSGAVGSTTLEEIQWLTKTLVNASAAWKATGWGYISDISKMSPVTPDISAELVNLHKALETSNCKAMAFVVGSSIFTDAQAKSHQKQSKAGIQEGHFKTEAEAIAWLDTIVK
ncbi:MAG: hypothetical protein E7478_04655 [Ruminococcaceae bacterium]|nr:hypothetical protein [Oscillospiraceae bacterium]